MPDRVLFPLMGLAALAMVCLALVWPQGLGARSPGPFGHTPVQQTAAVKAARAHTADPPPVLSIPPAAPAPQTKAAP